MESFLLFLIGLLFAAASIWSQNKDRVKWTAWLLFGMTFFIACGFATITNYFFIWDEQFHALVAKNISLNPAHPQLMTFAPWLFEESNWSSQTTWLHKPPFFLYAMATSIKLFGNTIIAARMPSVILLAITSRLVFLFGNNWKNSKVGFLAAFIFVFSGFTLLQLSGWKSTDHNDVFFTCLVFISFYFFQKYLILPSRKSALKIGVMVGLCVLTKWLPGLLVFLPWGILVLIKIVRHSIDVKNQIKWFALALFIAILVVLPWHLYTIVNFPEIAIKELSYNQEHFWIPLEGHRESFWFHFQNLLGVFRILLLLIFIPFYKWKQTDETSRILLISVLALLVFYSFAATKMEGFIGPTLPLISLLIAQGILFLLSTIQKERLILILAPLLILFFQPLQFFEKLGMKKGTIENEYHHLYRAQHDFIIKHGDMDSKKLILNANMRMHGNIQWMYFTQNKAISFVPSQQAVKRLKNEGFKLSAIQFGNPLPDYILKDQEIVKVKYE
ncbi:MAG: glycosyltransferase family 39 protein [Bacteroidetes bacterium]|nr:glycosyltransferase family 39 protein [Bacteroidota bacterium]